MSQPLVTEGGIGPHPESPLSPLPLPSGRSIRRTKWPHSRHAQSPVHLTGSKGADDGRGNCFILLHAPSTTASMHRKGLRWSIPNRRFPPFLAIPWLRPKSLESPDHFNSGGRLTDHYLYRRRHLGWRDPEGPSIRSRQRGTMAARKDRRHADAKGPP